MSTGMGSGVRGWGSGTGRGRDLTERTHLGVSGFSGNGLRDGLGIGGGRTGAVGADATELGEGLALVAGEGDALAVDMVEGELRLAGVDVALGGNLAAPVAQVAIGPLRNFLLDAADAAKEPLGVDDLVDE
jgi:hypothetical protein